MRSHHTQNPTKHRINQAGSCYSSTAAQDLSVTTWLQVNQELQCSVFMSWGVSITTSPTTSHHQWRNKELWVTFWAFLSCFTDVLAPASGLPPSVTGTCPFYENMCGITAGRSLYNHYDQLWWTFSMYTTLYHDAKLKPKYQYYNAYVHRLEWQLGTQSLCVLTQLTWDMLRIGR